MNKFLKYLNIILLSLLISLKNISASEKIEAYKLNDEERATYIEIIAIIIFSKLGPPKESNQKYIDIVDNYIEISEEKHSAFIKNWIKQFSENLERTTFDSIVSIILNIRNNILCSLENAIPEIKFIKYCKSLFQMMLLYRSEKWFESYKKYMTEEIERKAAHDLWNYILKHFPIGCNIDSFIELFRRIIKTENPIWKDDEKAILNTSKIEVSNPDYFK